MTRATYLLVAGLLALVLAGCSDDEPTVERPRAPNRLQTSSRASVPVAPGTSTQS